MNNRSLAIFVLALGVLSRTFGAADAVGSDAGAAVLPLSTAAAVSVGDGTLTPVRVGITSATVNWSMDTLLLAEKADVKLKYGTSAAQPDHEIMLVLDAAPGASGSVELSGLQEGTQYYVHLCVDVGNGYVSLIDPVPFTTGRPEQREASKKSITLGEPPIPGLNAGYQNSNTSSPTSLTMLPQPVLGVIAATNATSDLNDKTYPPIWANNRAWKFTGVMYFDGVSYYHFGKMIDDGTILKIDTNTIINDGTYNKWVGKTVKPTEGWHDIEIIFWNGTGGGGITTSATANQRIDKYGRDCGFAWSKDSSNTDPTNMSNMEWLCDPGDGSLLRTRRTTQFKLDISSFEIDETQYVISISNELNSAVNGLTLYYGESPDVNLLTNANNQLVRSFSLPALGQREFEIEWELPTAPYYTVVFQQYGVAPVDRLAATSWVEAEVKSVVDGTATLFTTVGYDTEIVGEKPPVSVTAYYGLADKGSSTSGWDFSKDFGALTGGDYDLTLDGLARDKVYYVRLRTSDGAWNDSALTVSTMGLSMGGDLEVYENDPREQKLVLKRSGTSAEMAKPVTVFLETSGAGGAVAGLPRSVTIPANTASVQLPFHVVDNASQDGDRTVTLTILDGAGYVVQSPRAGVITVVDDEGVAGEVVTWTGAVNAVWTNPKNWDLGRVPSTVDTARFTSTGLTSGKTITVSTSVTIRKLLIETPLAFTLSGAGGLAFSSLERRNVDGDEGFVDIKVPLTLGASDGAYSKWTIAGSNGVRLYKAFSAADGIRIWKVGDGELGLYATLTASDFSGEWYISGGCVRAAAVNAINGSRIDVIGGEDQVSSLVAEVDGAILSAADVFVGWNGFYHACGYAPTATAGNKLTVNENGTLELAADYGVGVVNVNGGTIDGVDGGRINATGNPEQKIVTEESASTAKVNVPYCADAANSIDFQIANGEQAIDLEMNGAITTVGTPGAGYITKLGDGAMRVTASWPGVRYPVEIYGGSVYADAPEAEGLGGGSIKVSTGTTLGGVGFLGGAATSENITVNVNGANGHDAMLSPGTVADDGSHVIGTLTVGSETMGGNVSLGTYSKFEAHIGSHGACDLLQVHGPVSIASTGTRVAVYCDDFSSLKSGAHVILRAKGGLSGQFYYEPVLPRPSWRLEYTDSEIIVVVPPQGYKFIVR